MTSKITIKEYLEQKGIKFRMAGKELIAHCVFGDCDKDSRSNEGHLYFNGETGQYDCKKCGEKGNLITLQKHFGDYVESLPKTAKTRLFGQEMAESCHNAIIPRIRQYLNSRGISDALISDHKLGYGRFYGSYWITIPIKDNLGNYLFFKLRQDPLYGSDKRTYPKGTDTCPVEAQIYDRQALEKGGENILICEGEFDCLLAVSKGIPAITSTHGAGTFKNDWIKEVVRKYQKIYICFDNDEAGQKGAQRIAKMARELGHREIYIISLPPEVGEKGDLTDYFVRVDGIAENLFEKYAKPYPERVDASLFEPLTSDKLADILGLTIKHDNDNKVVAFLCQLSAYTDNSQFNISFNAPSSTGKSYIPLEISNLFPKEDVLKLGACSPTAFFHEQGDYDEEDNTIKIDLSRKIIIFTEQPHTALLERLRSLLSHDEREMQSKITDKNQRGGNRTKTVILKGFPAVIFCTAGLRMDEQEATRFLLLSPETNQDKIRDGIDNAIRKRTDNEKYREWLDEDPDRANLIKRIAAIKAEWINEIIIENEDKIKQKFFNGKNKLKPRYQRDVERLLNIIKILALLNLWWRKRSGSTIIANDSDIEAGFALWDKIAVSQDYGLPPYILQLYKEVIIESWKEKNKDSGNNTAERGNSFGITRQEICDKHHEVYGRFLNPITLRQQILPSLETAGLITQEHNDPSDRRKVLIYPVLLI